LTCLKLESLALLRSIGNLAQAQGMAAYLVGGPVRDLMLKCPNIDLDITVEGSGIRLAEAFAGLHKGAKLVKYPSFKTATVQLPDGVLVDFATTRSESYVRGGAFPVVKSSKINDDLLRRDFTINAMAVSINPDGEGKLIDPDGEGKLIDPYGGCSDLLAKKIRVLHDKSFLDDPTRILRAARFKARLGFRMETQTLKLLKSAIKIKVLDTIKPQRYLKDFNKILKEPKSLEAIKILKSWDAYKA